MTHRLYELGHTPKMQFRWRVLNLKKHLSKHKQAEQLFLKNTLTGMLFHRAHQ